MGERVVIDASVAIAYLRNEISSPAVKAALADWARVSAELLVPSHFWIEVSNSLIRRHAQPPAAVVENFVDLDALAIRTIDPDRPLLLLAIDQMVRHGLSAYDAMYLSLALATDSRLATLDRRLADAAGASGLLIGAADQGLAEERAPYRVPSNAYAGWAHTAAVGAHIAQLRQRTSTET